MAKRNDDAKIAALEAELAQAKLTARIKAAEAATPWLREARVTLRRVANALAFTRENPAPANMTKTLEAAQKALTVEVDKVLAE